MPLMLKSLIYCVRSIVYRVPYSFYSDFNMLCLYNKQELYTNLNNNDLLGAKYIYFA